MSSIGIPVSLLVQVEALESIVCWTKDSWTCDWHKDSTQINQIISFCWSLYRSRRFSGVCILVDKKLSVRLHKLDLADNICDLMDYFLMKINLENNYWGKSTLFWRPHQKKSVLPSFNPKSLESLIDCTIFFSQSSSTWILLQRGL